MVAAMAFPLPVCGAGRPMGTAATAAVEATVPRTSGALPTLVNVRLAQAFPLAVARAREAAGCRALFDRLGANGRTELSATLYYAATPRQETQFCGRGSAAITMVRSPQTRLCPSFGALTPDWAATILIHEALHHAGLGEWPVDPHGMSSPDINRMVRRNCAF